jgi:hypothetical protein
MMQRFQQSLDAFFERFQDRWDTQPGFRTTWGIIGSALALVFLCSCALLGTNVLSGFFSGPTGPSSAQVIIGGNANNGSTFPVATDQQEATQIPLTTGTPVATVTYSPTATPTVTPAARPSPTPQPGGNGNDTPTPIPQPFTVSMTITPMIVGQQATITNVQTTNQPQPNQQLQITLQFGNDPNCTTSPNPNPVQLDNTGNYTGPATFTVPGCSPNNATVSATYSIDSVGSYTDPNVGTVTKG